MSSSAFESRPQGGETEVTELEVQPDVEAGAMKTYQYGGRNYYDNKRTKIKSVRNWYPDIDGNDVTKSYTTGF